jgi:hypothetical protein
MQLCQCLQSPWPHAHLQQALHAPINGKAERFIQTLYKEWAYGMALHNSKERYNWLPRQLSTYTGLKHTPLGGRSPQQWLNELLC